MGASSSAEKGAEQILAPSSRSAACNLQTDTAGDVNEITAAVAGAQELQSRTRPGVLRCDYEYTPTRGDSGAMSTYACGAEIRKVEGWTFEAVQRGPDPKTGEYPASEFRLVKGNGEVDAYWTKNWDAVPNRSGFIQVKSKPLGTKHTEGYFEEKDYTDGKVMRYEPHAVLEHMQKVIGDLTKVGVCGIVADVGYSQQFAASVKQMTDVPIVMSSLQQLSFLSRVYDLNGNPNKKIVVLTANGKTFDNDTMIPAGVSHDNVVVVGMEGNGFGAWVAGGKSFSRRAANAFDEASVEAAMEFVCEAAAATVAKVEADGGKVLCFVNECAELPAYTNILRLRLKLPVYDTITGIQFIQIGAGFSEHAAYKM